MLFYFSDCPMGCILSPVCITMLINSINIYTFCFFVTLQLDSHEREREEYYILPMQSAGYELIFDPVMTEPVRIRDL